MFDDNIFKEKSFRIVKEGSETIGYEMQSNIPYYRGVPLSMISDVKVFMDGQEAPREAIRVTVDNIDWFTLDEMKTVTYYKWEYNQLATIRVLDNSPIENGEHDVLLNIVARTAYIPIPLSGEKLRKVMIS